MANMPKYVRTLKISLKVNASKWRPVMMIDDTDMNVIDAIIKSGVGTDPDCTRSRHHGPSVLDDATYIYRCSNNAIVKVELIRGKYV